MADVRLRAVTAFDLRTVAEFMRPADRAEIARSTGSLPFPALVRAVTISAEAWCATVDHVPAALFGVAPGLTPDCGMYGIPWLLGTDLVTRHARELLRLAPAMIAAWRDRYGELWNLVDAENGQARRWLAHMGARLQAPAPWGVRDDPFILFQL